MKDLCRALAVASPIVAVALAVLLGLALSPGPRAATPTLFGAPNEPTNNFANPSWGNGRTMCLDPLSATSCSGGGSVSDNNDCSCSCTAPNVGPCVHWYNFMNRWNGYQPVFTIATPIKIVSNHVTTSDLIAFDPIVYNGVDVGIQGASYGAAQGGAVTLSNTTSKRRDFASQPLSTQLGALAVPNNSILLVNSTHPSVAWTTGSGTSIPVGISQPLTQAAPPLHTPCGFLAEVNTWANGDSVQAFQPVYASMAHVRPQFIGTNTDGGSAVTWPRPVYLWRLNFFGTDAQEPVDIGSGVQIIESQSANYSLTYGGGSLHITHNTVLPNGGLINYMTGTNVSVVSLLGPGAPGNPGFATPNSGFPSSNITSNGGAQWGRYCIFGGGVNEQAGLQTNISINSSNYSVYLDADFTLQSLAEINLDGVGQLGSVDMGSPGNGIQVNGSWAIVTGSYGGPQVWDQGLLQLNGRAQLEYESVASGEGGAFPSSATTFTMNAQTTACSHTNAATDVQACGIPITAARLDADAGGIDGGFAGAAFIPGGSSIFKGF